MAVERLAGSMGNRGEVFRDGATVLRPLGAHAAAVNTLLMALAERSFPAPVPLGPDGQGSELFDWIDGEVPVPPLPAWSLAPATLRSVGQLLRAYHETVADLALPPGLDWCLELADPEGGPIICHNDVCPPNVVFRDGEAFALLDFDYAAPGRPVWDLAQLARMWLPLLPPEMTPQATRRDPWPALGALMRGYRLDAGEHESFVDAIVASRRVGTAFTRRRVAAGEPAYLASWARLGGEAGAARISAWLEDNRDVMLRALAG